MRTTQIDSEINVLDRTFAYRTDPYTSQVAQLKYPSLKGGYAFHYTYDNAGNISGYELICANSGYNEAKFTYQYDSQNQLISATDGTVTFTYSYDDAGNILTANGHTYTYGNADWGDLLTAYDGSAITYDGVGNPLSYNGWNFTWKKGRQLAAATNGSTTVSYTYDADGLRTSKTVNGVVYTYYYVGSQLARMTYGDYVLDFFYDANGTPIAMRQGYLSSNNYTVYYYITNLQGDVIRLVDVNGSTAAYYEYDPYGNAIQAAGSHCNINPLRYRGYIYDSETSLYYVSSRYYNPEWGRWISAEPNVFTGGFDNAAGLLSHNVFAYCANNPINYFDPTGEAIITTLIICVIGGSVIGGTIGGIAGNSYANDKGYTGWEKAKAILTGIGIGGFAGGTLGYFAAPMLVSFTGIAGISVTFRGISTVVALGTSFGKLGTLIANNGQQIINWSRTTLHGMQRMTERGVTKNMVEAWVKTGKALQQAGDKILYVTKQGAVVIDKAGRIITAYTSREFTADMREIVEKLFGK